MCCPELPTDRPHPGVGAVPAGFPGHRSFRGSIPTNVDPCKGAVRNQGAAVCLDNRLAGCQPMPVLACGGLCNPVNWSSSDELASGIPMPRPPPRSHPVSSFPCGGCNQSYLATVRRNTDRVATGCRNPAHILCPPAVPCEVRTTKSRGPGLVRASSSTAEESTSTGAGSVEYAGLRLAGFQHVVDHLLQTIRLRQAGLQHLQPLPGFQGTVKRAQQVQIGLDDG